LESSGSGWHVWAISPDFKPIAHWIRLLKGIARDIGAPIEIGACEIYPPDTLSRGFGKGMRAPGAFNPGTNTFDNSPVPISSDTAPLLAPGAVQLFVAQARGNSSTYLVVANSLSNNILMYQELANGQFNPPTSYAVGDNPDDAIAHLRLALEREESLRPQAAVDSDLDAIRDRRAFRDLIGQPV
jgi:hypothetical protein